ncbi:MAG TPA: dienelactone hydrolase family protein [Gemmatimonadaceae bacterium]|nr:dienelactone hydrolase family protein [Gemmatimonadaceae bacterium]
MIETNIDIRTPDGTADGVLVRPDADDRVPGVIVLTDIWGIRPAFVDLAKRIADHGYAVLLPNIFYRSGKPPFAENMDFQDPRTRARVGEISRPLTPEKMESDGSAYVDSLSAQRSVSDGPMGVVGFCFAGQFSVRTAAARPDRIGAAASFHGGGLYKDDDSSPHRVLPRIKARLYFGHAMNDGSMTASQIQLFETALEKWGGEYSSETYNARHGWMIPGREMFDPGNAAKGFAKLMELFDSSLKNPVTVA